MSHTSHDNQAIVSPSAEPESATAEATDSASLADVSAGPLPPVGLLHALLKKQRIAVQSGALAAGCEQIDKEQRQLVLSQRLAAVFNQLQLKGVQAALLRWSRFDQRKLPALLHHQQQWFLLDKSDAGAVSLQDEAGTIHDPEPEALAEAFVLFLRTPAGGATTSSSFKQQGAGWLVLTEMFRTRRWIRDVAIATVLVNLLAVGTSLFAMQVYDRVVPTLAYSTLWTLVVGMGIVISLDWLLKTIRARILDSVSCAVNNRVSQRVFDHIMQVRLDLRPRSLGTLAAQVGGLDSVRQFFSSGVVFALVDMPFALMFIAFISVIGGPVGWVYLCLLPIAALLGYSTQARLRRLTREQLIRSNERQGLLVDSIQGAESIRSNNATWRFSEQWHEITRTIGHYNIQNKAISNFSTVSTGSLSSAAYISAIVVGVQQIEAGNLTMGGLIACSILGGRVIAPIAQSVQQLVQWQNVAQSLQMVDQLLRLDTERDPDQNLLIPEQTPSRIELLDLTFSYPNSPIKQLDIPTLRFNAGDRVLLLGAIGSGKSTLLKTLAGLYRPSSGRIRLGAADLWEMEPNAVAEVVGYLPQNVHLFKGTLRSNLALSGAVGDSQLLQLCEVLGIDQIAAASPQGLNLEISEGGEGLSGGQKQMVGLGRLLLGRPRIWLLDEPTASLDTQADSRVMATLHQYIQPNDIVVISTHRPALALEQANRVIVLHEGRIIEDGRPEQVLTKVMGQRAGATKQQAEAAGSPAMKPVSRGPGHVI